MIVKDFTKFKALDTSFFNLLIDIYNNTKSSYFHYTKNISCDLIHNEIYDNI